MLKKHLPPPLPNEQPPPPPADVQLPALKRLAQLPRNPLSVLVRRCLRGVRP